MSIEPNDIISDANDSNVSSDGTRSTTINGSIDPANDVDLYSLQVNSGDGIILDVDSAILSSGLDPILRLFDSSGNELAVSDDDAAPGEDFSVDPYLTFVANTTGDYYVGVSSFSNFEYDPFDSSNSGNNSGGSNGDYELNIDLVEVEPDDDPDNTIAEAIDTNISSSGQDSTVIQDSISPQGDADVYKFQLDEGDVVSLNINASDLDTGLDPILRLFDESGNELVVNDDNNAPGEDFSLDSYIEFTAPATGNYYVGVSGFSDFDYDVINGRTNFDSNQGFLSTGDYELVINAFDRIDGTNDGDILLGDGDNDYIEGLNGEDILTGFGQNDILLGGAGDDILTGNNGNDTLIGGDGDDQLYGDRGDDVLQGGAGTNFYYGRGGADIFVVDNITNVDNTIFDFEDGTDKILINGASFFSATIEESDTGFGTSISVFGNTVANLINIDPSNISEDDFVV